MKEKPLNTSELEVMEYLWKLDKGFLKDILAMFPEPKPAHNTVSTVLSRMCAKNYVGFEKLGRDKIYFPIIRKKSYFNSQNMNIISRFFDNSPANFVSSFAKDSDMTIEQLEELKKLVNDQIATKNKKQL